MYKRINLGSGYAEVEAALIYDYAARQAWGEYANPNFSA